MSLTARDKKAFQAYIDLRRDVVSQRTAVVPVGEPATVRAARIARLLGNFTEFCKYYLPHYMTDKTGRLIEFGYFHRQAAKAIIADPNVYAVLEWPREHAKSVFADVMMALYLKAKGELSGLIITSATQKKAIMLLLGLQAELESNARYVHDFGEQHVHGDWQEGEFATRDGVGFWALGRGQSPRGTRKAEKRPNCCVIDDLDDDELVQSEERVDKVLDWVEGALIPALDTKGARIIVAGNRIHKNAVLAHLVGDVHEGDLVKPRIYHSKVYALENPRTRQMDYSDTGVPAWKENYSREVLMRKFSTIRYKMVMREYFHQHTVEGKVFKADWLHYVALPPLSQYPFIVVYNDPSWKDTKKNDYKAITAQGALGKYRDLIDCWVDQASRQAMVKAQYDMHEKLLEGGARLVMHFIEGNLVQDIIMDDYVAEGDRRGYMLPIVTDKRQKPDKIGRIETNLQGLFEQGLYRINEALRGNRHFQNWKDQLLSFPSGHDDAPDSTEGGIYLINQKIRLSVPEIGGGRRRQTRW